LNCVWCEEVIQDGEQHENFPSDPMHFECGFRSICGSVAHQLRRCHCFKLGSKLSDPPGLTKREAARAALALFRQIAEWYGPDADSAREIKVI
jgi:hypothetical protein